MYKTAKITGGIQQLKIIAKTIYAKGVAIGKKELQGLLHPCKLADFTFYTSD